MKASTAIVFGVTGIVTVFFVLRIFKSRQVQKERKNANIVTHFQHFKVLESKADGKCLYHSLFTVLKNEGLLGRDVQNTNQLMMLIREVYESIAREKNVNPLLHAFKRDFFIESKKIDYLIQLQRVPIQYGYPDVGMIQLLVHSGLFPFKVNFGVLNEDGRLDMTNFGAREDPGTKSVFIRQIGGDRNGGGHFDALHVAAT